MRVWHFSSSVNSSNTHAQPSSGARCLIFRRTLYLLPYFMLTNSEGSGAFTGRLYDIYHNLVSWLNYPVYFSGKMKILHITLVVVALVLQCSGQGKQ